MSRPLEQGAPGSGSLHCVLKQGCSDTALVNPVGIEKLVENSDQSTGGYLAMDSQPTQRQAEPNAVL